MIRVASSGTGSVDRPLNEVNLMSGNAEVVIVRGDKAEIRELLEEHLGDSIEVLDKKAEGTDVEGDLKKVKSLNDAPSDGATDTKEEKSLEDMVAAGLIEHSMVNHIDSDGIHLKSQGTPAEKLEAKVDKLTEQLTEMTKKLEEQVVKKKPEDEDDPDDKDKDKDPDPEGKPVVIPPEGDGADDDDDEDEKKKKEKKSASVKPDGETLTEEEQKMTDDAAFHDALMKRFESYKRD